MARLTTKERNKLPDSDFAGPHRSFPVQDEAHARNALARASQFHPELKAKIKAKIRKKFPGIQIGKMHGGEVHHHRMDKPRRRKG